MRAALQSMPINAINALLNRRPNIKANLSSKVQLQADEVSANNSTPACIGRSKTHGCKETYYVLVRRA